MTATNGPWDARRSGRDDRNPEDRRPKEEQDRSRIIHCSSFRGLQGKTQVLGITESDFHRTRLTHSMEVAQIGRGIVLQLLYSPNVTDAEKLALPSVPRIEAISFGHDLGHPPFGHSGEVALNCVMRDAGGFEGNGQSLRILSHLELHTHLHGLNLTRRALLGVIKYPAQYNRVRRLELPPISTSISAPRVPEWKPPKCYLETEEDVVEWVLAALSNSDRTQFAAITEPTKERHGKTLHKSLDASVLDLADDIAYGAHDFEDGVALRLISQDTWNAVSADLDTAWGVKYKLSWDWLTNSLFLRPSEIGNRKLAVSRIINALVCSVKVVEQNQFESPLLSYRVELQQPAGRFLKALNKLCEDNVINTQTVQTLEHRGRYMIIRLLEAISSDPRMLLNESSVLRIEDGEDPQRVVCDYVAGMTDAFATRMYERLFVPRQGSVFERL